jgi:hypothetical protein
MNECISFYGFHPHGIWNTYTDSTICWLYLGLSHAERLNEWIVWEAEEEGARRSPGL